MGTYLRVFINWEQNNQIRLLLIAEFAYNNYKNFNTDQTPFKLNCGYYSYVFFKNKCNVCSKSSSAKRLAMKLRELINIYCQNLLHAQDFQKRAYDKGVKPWNYTPSEKVWLNSKYIKIKRNRKLKAKFLGFFKCSTQLRSKYTSWNYQQGGKSMMCSTYYCWSRTPQGKGGCSQYQNLSQAITKNTRWKLSEIVQSMPRKQINIYQGYTIWLHRKGIWKKRTPKNLFLQSFTFKKWLAPSTKTIRRSQQQHQYL